MGDDKDGQAARCRHCRKPLPEADMGKHKICADCRAKMRIYNQKFYKARVNAGLCPKCGQPVDNTAYRHCSACRGMLWARGKEIFLERIKQNVCLTCGRPLDNYAYKNCSSCRSKLFTRLAIRREKLFSKGLCIYCGKPLPPDLAGKRKSCPACSERMNSSKRPKPATQAHA